MKQEECYLNKLSPSQLFHLGQIYGDLENLPEIPEGYKFVDFRPPKLGETFLGSINGEICRELDYDWTIGRTYNRIIVERTSEVVSDQIFTVVQEDVYGSNEVVMPEGYMFVRFGYPAPGDLFMAGAKFMMVQQPPSVCWSKASGPRIIVTRKD